MNIRLYGSPASVDLAAMSLEHLFDFRVVSLLEPVRWEVASVVLFYESIPNEILVKAENGDFAMQELASLLLQAKQHKEPIYAWKTAGGPEAHGSAIDYSPAGMDPWIRPTHPTMQRILELYSAFRISDDRDYWTSRLIGSLDPEEDYVITGEWIVGEQIRAAASWGIVRPPDKFESGWHHRTIYDDSSPAALEQHIRLAYYADNLSELRKQKAA